MRIVLITALMFLAFTGSASAQMVHNAHDDPTLFHYSRLEADAGYDRGEEASRWDLDAWLGSDENKLWLKSEGDLKAGTAVKAEFWGLFSRNVADFWDVQAGLRQDTNPRGSSYLTAGIEGLAPYYFETEGHVFVSDRGDLSARLKERNDLLLTQRLIAQPYFEADLFAQSDTRRYIGSGMAGSIGIQTRYEFSRQFAPYIDLRYDDKFGAAGRQARRAEDDRSSFVASAGLRLMY